MTLTTRALISLLSGIGCGLLGFTATYNGLEAAGQTPGVGWDAVLLTSIFLPFVAGTLLVFHTLSRAVTDR